MTELALFSSDLLSKWGFNDGDWPDHLLDWLDECGVDYTEVRWRPLLCELVRTRLLPVLEQRVKILQIETAHNPIRAESVDGVDVTECWYNRQPEPTLTPDCVTVPFDVVRSLIWRSRDVDRDGYRAEWSA